MKSIFELVKLLVNSQAIFRNLNRLLHKDKFIRVLLILSLIYALITGYFTYKYVINLQHNFIKLEKQKQYIQSQKYHTFTNSCNPQKHIFKDIDEVIIENRNPNQKINLKTLKLHNKTYIISFPENVIISANLILAKGNQKKLIVIIEKDY